MPTTLTDLHVPSITTRDVEAAPEATAVAYLIASIAGSDGVLTPHEFATGLGVAETVAGLSDDPAVLRSLILRAFDAPPRPLDMALRELTTLRAAIPERVRRLLLEALFPLLLTQGEQARPLARRVAAALDAGNVEPLLDLAGLPAEAGTITILLRRAGNTLHTAAWASSTWPQR